MSRFGRLPPPKPRQPADYRNTKIDVFVGGPADGRLMPTNGNREHCRVVIPPKVPLNLYSDDPIAVEERFDTASYRQERMRCQRGETVADITFWIAEGMSTEMALLKLCLGYHPELVEETAETP